ncbi:hypothetical protein LSCM1_06639 [Leishmania martiniquensis]|uniref:Uncharacterized protein n=1 Tax=Leishmania martiniquensis TaxID=1580590 RepID=A0A836HYF3_9TRYP|nr:hypothetical protein LSCM1_06639 [Leishmania martiniquensis]
MSYHAISPTTAVRHGGDAARCRRPGGAFSAQHVLPVMRAGARIAAHDSRNGAGGWGQHGPRFPLRLTNDGAPAPLMGSLFPGQRSLTAARTAATGASTRKERLRGL